MLNKLDKYVFITAIYEWLETQKATMGVLSCTIYTSNIFSVSS